MCKLIYRKPNERYIDKKAVMMLNERSNRMLHSSLGFHTMTLSLLMESNTVRSLIRDFRKYSRDTGLVQIYRDGKNKIFIRYYREDKGIAWSIRSNNWDRNFQSYMVEATINPKILAGIRDYITAATYEDMDAAITNFNLEASAL